MATLKGAVSDLSDHHTAGLATIVADVTKHIEEGKYNRDVGVWTVMSLIREAGGWSRIRGCFTSEEADRIHGMHLYRWMPGIMNED